MIGITNYSEIHGAQTRKLSSSHFHRIHKYLMLTVLCIALSKKGVEFAELSFPPLLFINSLGIDFDQNFFGEDDIHDRSPDIPTVGWKTCEGPKTKFP